MPCGLSQSYGTLVMLVDRWLGAEGRQLRGIVGHAEARLSRSRDIIGAEFIHHVIIT